MEDWDQDTLEDVVKQKHGSEKPANKTEIICKFFLDAVESKLYGWWALYATMSLLCAICRTCSCKRAHGEHCYCCRFLCISAKCASQSKRRNIIDAVSGIRPEPLKADVSG